MDLNKEFWNDRYEQNTTGWDLGMVSPALKYWIDQLLDRKASILIPGAGNAYEVDELLLLGFENITVIDIAPTLVEKLIKKYKANNRIRVLLGDFFELNDQFDVILEQTFFCAIDPSLRSKYIRHMKNLLRPDGQLLGVLFDRTFSGGPPFGGSREEYQSLFDTEFMSEFFDCHVSHPARSGSEVLFRCSLKV